MRGRGLRAGRGFVLYVVLIVVTIAALMAGSVVYAAHSQRAAADAASRRVQSRAIAWSGVQAVMEELRAQRGELIRGGEPDVPDEWTMFADGSGRIAVARLVPSADGARLVSESGKLDINRATEGMLALVPGVGEEAAKRIIAARNGRKFLSVHELEGIEGLRGAVSGSAGGEDEANASEDAFVPPDAADAARPLAELLTVFAFDPNVQAGIGERGEPYSGVRRISLGGKWSERLGAAITERFDEGAANIVKSLMEQGTKFDKESDIVKVLRRFNVEPQDWPEVLDAFCGDGGPYRLGRLDVLTAPREALACVPGIDSAAAEQIVLRRSKLAPEQRRSVVWLVEETVLTPEQFELAVDHLASRSLQWRVVIEAGYIETEDGESEDRPALTNRVVVEAVLDVASERPRVAYLRETTMEEAARALGPLRPPPPPKKEDPEARVASAPPVPAVSSSPGRTSAGRGRAARAPERPAGGNGGPGGAADGSAAAADEKDPRLGRWTPGGS